MSVAASLVVFTVMAMAFAISVTVTFTVAAAAAFLVVFTVMAMAFAISVTVTFTVAAAASVTAAVALYIFAVETFCQFLFRGIPDSEYPAGKIKRLAGHRGVEVYLH